MKKQKRKLKQGDKVKYQGKIWTVCKGGFSSPETKSYVYRIHRGRSVMEVPGNCLRNMLPKFLSGDKVEYEGKVWTVCSSPSKPSLYHIRRGAWHEYVSRHDIKPLSA